MQCNLDLVRHLLRERLQGPLRIAFYFLRPLVVPEQRRVPGEEEPAPRGEAGGDGGRDRDNQRLGWSDHIGEMSAERRAAPFDRDRHY
jgi:hypothetical protein